jgi:hypothetical protein
MPISLEAIIFWILLIDSIGANITAWFFPTSYKKNISKGIVKHFPVSKGWCLYYLILVLFIGYLIYFT